MSREIEHAIENELDAFTTEQIREMRGYVAETVAWRLSRDGFVPLSRVLDGDPGEIEAALDALPVGSIVESSAEAVADQEPRAWSRESNGMSRDHVGWRGTGRMTMFGSDYLARYCAPLVVISR